MKYASIGLLLFCLIIAFVASMQHHERIKVEQEYLASTRSIAEASFANAQDANIEAAKSNQVALDALATSQESNTRSKEAIKTAQSLVIEYDGLCQAVMPATGDVYKMECVTQ